MTERRVLAEAPGLPWPLRPQGDLPDINVWLALAVEEHPHHAAARGYWLSACASGTAPAPTLWFCRVTMLGLVRLLCQPKVVGEGALALDQALALYARFRAIPDVGLLADAEGCEARLQALVTAAAPLPPRLWTDAYLAAMAQSAGLKLVSFDTDFRRFGPEHCRVLPPV